MQITINMHYILILILLLPFKAFSVAISPTQLPVFIKKMELTSKFLNQAMKQKCDYNALRCLILNQDIALITEYFQMLKQGRSAKDLSDEAIPNLNQQELDKSNLQIINNYMVLTLSNKNGTTSTIYIPRDLNLEQQRDYLIKRNSILRDLFAANESINKIDELGFTSLHYAAATNSNQMVDLLVSFGAKPYKSNNEFALQSDAIAMILGSNLIIPKLMTICGREEISNQREFNLLSYYSYFGKDWNVLDQIYNFNFATSNPNLLDKYGNTPAFYAAFANNPDFLQYFIKTKLADPNVINGDGKTMLIYTAQYSYEEAAKMLLSLKANPNIEDYSKRTAISYALINQDYKMTKLLLDSGADIDIFDRKDMSPMFYAIKINNKYVLDFFLSKNNFTKSTAPDGYNPLTFAMTNGYWESAAFLINAGYNVNSPAPDGMTPLMLAAGNGQLNLVKALITKGANPNIKSQTNNTALSYSLTSTDAENIAVFLIQNGADPFIANDDGMTVAGLAGLNNKDKIILAIIDQRPDLKSMLSHGKFDELSLNICTYLSEAYFGPCLYNVKTELISLKDSKQLQ